MKISDQRGGALIEFALVLPLMLLILAGIADFGILFYNKQVITNASREGARAGIVSEKDDDGERIIVSEAVIQSIVVNYCQNKLWNFNEDPDVVVGGDASFYPDDLIVTVTIADYTLLLSPLLNIFGGNFGELDVTAETIMRME